MRCRLLGARSSRMNGGAVVFNGTNVRIAVFAWVNS